jgi:RNA polymerase sigma-70 factor (ECF subfamily)
MEAPGTPADAPPPGSPQQRALVARFAAAFQSGDVPGVIALLTDDALMTMPPEAAEYAGPQAIGRFLSTVPAAGSLERFRLVPTRANGQPAFGCYLRDPHTPIATRTASWCSRCAATAWPAWPASPTPRCSRRSGFRGR